MKHLITYTYLLILSATPLPAKTLKATVLDAKTKEPVIGANVYLDGTTIGTVTGTDGKFALDVFMRIYTKLVISFVGYESVLIPDPFEGIPEVIYLEEKDNRLDEVVVIGKPTFTEKQKMKAFREQFLGRTRAGQSCRIRNEDVIRLIYDPEANKLHGYADAPIEIENSYLGYFIRCELLEFMLDLKPGKKSLYPDNVSFASITGAAFFREIQTNDIISYRRESIYSISLRRFFQLLSDKTIHKSGFSIFKNEENNKREPEKVIPVGDCFEIIKKPSDSQITAMALNPAQKDSAGIISMIVSELSIAPSVYSDLKYRRDKYSKLYFLTDTFYVDKYGNTDLIKNLIVTGVMGYQRLGDTLPFDYLPPANNWLDEVSQKK
jgi:hypothetical protein